MSVTSAPPMRFDRHSGNGSASRVGPAISTKGWSVTGSRRIGGHAAHAVGERRFADRRASGAPRADADGRHPPRSPVVALRSSSSTSTSPARRRSRSPRRRAGRRASRPSAGSIPRRSRCRSDRVVRLVERDVVEQLERLRAGRRAPSARRRASIAGGRPGSARQQQRAAEAGRRIAARQRQAIGRRIDLERHPGARVAAVVERIVEQPRVAAHRDALARGAEIGLGRHRVLEVRSSSARNAITSTSATQRSAGLRSRQSGISAESRSSIRRRKLA